MRIFGKNLDPQNLSFIHQKLQLRDKGGQLGLFARQNIGRGEILTKSAGIILPTRAVQELPQPILHFAFYLEHGYYFSPLSAQPSADWYMNHSCTPNAGAPNEALVTRALRNIRADEEVCYDYESDHNDQEFKSFRSFRCTCGAKNCRKIIRW